MKEYNPIVAPLALLSAATLLLASCSSNSTPPPDVGSARIEYIKGVPGGVIAQTFSTTATVTAINQANRKMVLLGSDRKEFVMEVGPEVVNLGQIRVGDKVNATVTQKIAASLGKENTAADNGAVAVVAGKGDKPGGVITDTSEVSARIAAVDSGNRTATLRFDDGTIQTFPIRSDVELNKLTLGSPVVFRVTEMIAIRVEKSP